MNRYETELAEKIKSRCIEAAKQGFRDASISGLCRDGAIEAAVSAIQKLDAAELVKSARTK
jgi:hypothetical protein